MLDLRRKPGQAVVVSGTHLANGEQALIHIQLSNIKHKRAGISISSVCAEVDGVTIDLENTDYRRMFYGDSVTVKSLNKWGEPVEFILMITALKHDEATLSFHAPKDIRVDRTEKKRRP